MLLQTDNQDKQGQNRNRPEITGQNRETGSTMLSIESNQRVNTLTYKLESDYCYSPTHIENWERNIYTGI